MNRGEFLVERCPTGISGFDDLCAGGLVRNSVSAVLGGPGAGKTIFLLQFLYNGVMQYKENGIYISFEPDVVELFKDAAVFGWDFQKLDQKDQIKIMKISPQVDIDELKKDLTKMIAKYDLRRVCIDPISFFGMTEKTEGKVREVLFDLCSTLKRLKVTVLLANETASTDSEEVGIAAADIKGQYVKFLVDAVVDIYSSGLGGVSDRAVRIAKMRRTNHVRGPVPMEISDDGISVVKKSKKGLL